MDIKKYYIKSINRYLDECNDMELIYLIDTLLAKSKTLEVNA